LRFVKGIVTNYAISFTYCLSYVQPDNVFVVLLFVLTCRLLMLIRYATSSANMRVAVYGAKHEAAPYEELLRQICAVKELVSVNWCSC